MQVPSEKCWKDKKIIKLGIGDVTRPLSKVTTDAIIKAVKELRHKETFRGYGPELGYTFAKNAVKEYYKRYSIDIDYTSNARRYFKLL